MFSWPRLGPITRSSTMFMGAASEPDLSSSARLVASDWVRPVVWKFLPNTPCTVALLMTISLVLEVCTSLPSTVFTSGMRSMYTTAIGLPTFLVVKSNMRVAAAESSSTLTVGWPDCESKPALALSIWSPEAITCFLSTIGWPSRM